MVHCKKALMPFYAARQRFSHSAIHYASVTVRVVTELGRDPNRPIWVLGNAVLWIQPFKNLSNTLV